MKKKINSEDLQIGMFVTELDRPWLESHFLFQGFTITNDSDLEDVRRTCAYVYVDFNKSAARSPAITAGLKPAQPHAYKMSFEDEVPKAEQIHDLAHGYVGKLFDDVRLGKAIDSAEAKGIVGEMMASIIRNPDALMLLSNLRAFDEDEINHSMDVCTLAIAFGNFLGMQDGQLEELGLAALLHDIGETRVDPKILKKRYGLTPEETRQMQTHADCGAEILEAMPGIPKSAAEVARSHHEKINGKGYPRGLTGDDIGLFTRIVAIADVYDRVTHSDDSGRYLSSTDALKNMYEYRGQFFDGDLIEKFIQCLGIYPVGSVVEMNTGEIGVVISVPPDNHLAPKLMLVRNADKKPVFPPHIINLKLYRGSKDNLYSIGKVLQPNAYGIDLKRYMLRDFIS